MKRELNIKPIYEFRYDERLKTRLKDEKFASVRGECETEVPETDVIVVTHKRSFFEVCNLVEVHLLLNR